ncbi:MAG: hypothetical protein C4530_18280 [Desulfobacteraceae bacterium]|nr:MAG: hypothetical protein C4530_18280 [Desulfobacteraceae bacterium]
MGIWMRFEAKLFREQLCFFEDMDESETVDYISDKPDNDEIKRFYDEYRKYLDEEKVIRRGIEALMKELGPVETIRSLTFLKRRG